MRKVGIIVVVALLAVSGIVAALAYTSATVTNPMEVKIVNTNEAVLAMSLGSCPGDVARIEGGVLILTPDEGEGFQPNSEYEFEDIFRVTNNSNKRIYVSWEAEGNLATLVNDGVFKVYIRNPNDLVPIWAEWGQRPISYTGDPEGTREVMFVFNVPLGYNLGDYSGNFVVYGIPRDWP